jgi:hypothetical protein
VSNVDEERREADLEVAVSRRVAEQRLTELKSAVAEVAGDVARVPRSAALWMVVLAGAGGFALSFRRRQKRRLGQRRP